MLSFQPDKTPLGNSIRGGNSGKGRERIWFAKTMNTPKYKNRIPARG
jgi:hypothetical protein